MLFAQEKRVLVCMPTYHSPQEWIERAVASLKAQTYEDFDCWIVKDGCRWACGAMYSEKPCLECELCGRTTDFCRKINDKRFHFYQMPFHFGGAGWAPRNFAILNTKHDLIAYLDDDNWYEPDHLASLHETITKNKTDMAYTGTRLYDHTGKVIHERLHNAVPAQGYIDTSEIIHRRKLIFQHGGWRYVPKGNDWDIVKRWLPGATWSHTNKITLNFFVRENCGIHRH